MRPLLPALAFLTLAAMAGCTTPVTGVVRLYDGILRAADAAQAEAYCRKDGNPIRFLEAADAPNTPGRGVLFRCD
jgi:hemolysin-activating ACP:hemolysin acyltransferase